MKVFFVLCLAAALAGPGQAATVPAGGTGARKQSAVARPGQFTDSQIEQAIKAKLAKSKMTLVGHEHFTVSVKGGVATFDGKTSVIQHKGMATRMARTSGAIGVNNRIEISEAAKAKAIARLQGQSSHSLVARGPSGPTKPVPKKSADVAAPDVAGDDPPALPRAAVLPRGSGK
jgi:hypothetical protein